MLVGAGPLGGGGRRFLLTGVISRYHYEPTWNREELAGDLERMIGLFTGELGYEHVPWIGLDPTSRQIEDALRNFCTDPDRQSGDYVVVYLAGHGDVLDIGTAGAEHVLLPADAVPSDPYRRVVRSADLARWMLVGTRVHRLLVLLDTCFAGQGGLDFTQNAAAWAGNWGRFDAPDGSGVVVISATQPKQEATPGAFTEAFVSAAHDAATAGHAPGALAVDAVVSVMNTGRAMPTTQRTQWSLVLGNGMIPEFLPNPRWDTTLVDLDLMEQARRWRWQQEEEHRRAEELRGQFIPRIGGFIGRGQALTDLSRWLEDAVDTRPRVVTGDPGSGKTAVLGLLAALSDPQRRPTIPRDGLPVGIIPHAGMIDVAVYAGNLSSGQVLAALVSAADIEDLDPDPAAFDLEIARLLARLRERAQPMVAVVDALDEAADPPDLAERLLRPMIERGRGAIRLLLGSRRHVCPYLGPEWSRSCEVIDLDTARYADPHSLAEVVRRTLRRGDPSQTGTSPFADCPPAILETATAAITEAAGRSFFVARILATAQACQPRLPDLVDPAWRASLPRQAGPAMRQDLETRLAGQADRAIDLLRPLAYAQGPGLPWEDIWGLLASALAPGHVYTNDDLLWLAARAGSYIVESGTIGDRSLYRLYHRSLNEYLRGGRDQYEDQRAITSALAGHVSLRVNGRRDWTAAHPYIRACLATHAGDAGMIDDLSQDPGFLITADPLRLLDALDRTASTTGRAVSDAYRRALPLMRRHEPAEHPAYLALAARCGRAATLADRITADGLNSRWRPLWASWQLQRPHQVVTGHGGAVHAVAAAELDGRPVVISGSGDSTIRVWDLATGTPVTGPITGHDGAVHAVAAAELDGRPVVISGSGDSTIRVWDLATGTPVTGPITGHDGAVHAVAAAELDGRPVVISGSADSTIRVWDLATGTPVTGPITGHDGAVHAVAAAELDGRPVLISGSDHTVQIWDLATGTPAGNRVTDYGDWVRSVAAAQLAGRPVVISGSGRTIRVWDLATGTPVTGPITGHGGAVHAVAAAELDGRPIVISGSDHTVQIWDLATGTPMGNPFTGHGGAVHAVAAAELEGRPVVISGSDDETVRVWDLAASTPVADPFTGHDGYVYALAAAELAGRPVVISGGSDRTVRAWDLATGAAVGIPFTGHRGDVYTLATAELEGRPVVISAGSDRTIRIWDLATGTPMGNPFTGHGDWVRSVAVAQLEGRPVVISGSSDGMVRVWDLATGTPVGNPFTGHGDWVRSVAVAQLEGRPVVISAGDGIVRVWDLATGTPVGNPFTGHGDWVRSVAVAQLEGRPVVISAGSDRMIRVWDLATGTPMGNPFTGHDGAVHAVAAAELGGRPVVISVGSDGLVRVWDLATGTALTGPFTGHGGAVYAVATAELAGRPVVISGSDRMILGWDLATGTPMGNPFTGHDGAVHAVAAAELAGRPVVVSGGSDRTVRVWDLATGTPVTGPITGHDGYVYAVAAAELAGRPVVISGSSDRTVRVWDLATGTPVTGPFTRLGGNVYALATAELGGRPVVISGSSDRTVRAWDLATGTPMGNPFTGHGGAVYAVATAELGGRPVVISGSSDRTVRAWDLATGTPMGNPFTGHGGAVYAVATAELGGRPVVISGSSDGTVRAWDLATSKPIAKRYFDDLDAVRSEIWAMATNFHGLRMRPEPVFAVVSAGDRAIFLAAPASVNSGIWTHDMTVHLGNRILSMAWHTSKTLIAATEAGIVVLGIA